MPTVFPLLPSWSHKVHITSKTASSSSPFTNRIKRRSFHGGNEDFLHLCTSLWSAETLWNSQSFILTSSPSPSSIHYMPETVKPDSLGPTPYCLEGEGLSYSVWAVVITYHRLDSCSFVTWDIQDQGVGKFSVW